MDPMIKISDHAVIRWLERSGLVDIEAVRRDITNSLQPAFSAAAKVGASNFVIRRERWRYIFKDGSTLVTCYREQKPKPLRQHASEID